MRIYEKNFKEYIKIRETAALMKLDLSMNLKSASCLKKGKKQKQAVAQEEAT